MQKLVASLSKYGAFFPFLYALAAGLYPIVYYYSKNFTLVATWRHLGYFALIYIGIPFLCLLIAQQLIKKGVFGKYGKYVLPFINLSFFFVLILLTMKGILLKKLSVGLICLAALMVFFLYKHFKKWVLLQLLLAGVSLVWLVPQLVNYASISEDWKKQPDAIASTVLKSKPNIYFIQPDGYVNFSELRQGAYGIDPSTFQNYLTAQNFVHYPNTHSNYPSTLTSNSATFMMKHHYYEGKEYFKEMPRTREVIVSDNTVLEVLKNNGYQTNLLIELPYFMLSRPQMGYDFCNFSYTEVSPIGTGLGKPRDVLPVLQDLLNKESQQPQFYFIEVFAPGHIRGAKSLSKGKEKEKEIWLEDLDAANERLTGLIDAINSKDPNALIIMLADHGGFVGLDYTAQYQTKTQERDIIYSMFSANLSIKWPQEAPTELAPYFKSNVNVFRVLFSHLANDPVLLENLQPDTSYVPMREQPGVDENGIYEYIDDSGGIVFKKVRGF